MALELQQLRQVLALAEHGSFVRAAASLHISQPALSRSIQNLERRFGSDLFLRSSSGAVPTDLGRLYIERARDVLRMADELDREAVSHGKLRTGRVAVGGGPFPADAVLGRAAAKFIEQHPGASVRVQARDWDELAQQLRSRELDFFVAEASTLTREPDLEVMPMPAHHPVYLVARAGHPLAGRNGVSIEDALEWPFATPGRVPPRLLQPLLSAHRAASKRIAVARPFPSIECNSLATVKRVVADSDAITGTILSCISSELESGRFVLLTREPWLHLQYGVTSLKGLPLSRIAQRFLELTLDAERECAVDEQRLVTQFDPRRARRRRAPRA
jgi:DNA-binding transcriptional LysR family regulator